MNLTNKQIRERARHLLDDNVFGKDWLKSVITIALTLGLGYLIISGAVAITSTIVTLLTSLLSLIPGANTTLIGIIAWLVVILVEALVTAGIGGNTAIGLAYVNLDLVRGDGSISIRKFLDGFRNFADHFMLGFMCSLQIALWSFLFIIPGIYVSYSYALAFHIKADHPEYHWRDCLDESERLMTGNRWRLFKLHLSFFGWIILGTLAFAGVGELWAVGYEQTSTAIFYEQVKAEKDNLMDEYGMSTSGPVVYSR